MIVRFWRPLLALSTYGILAMGASSATFAGTNSPNETPKADQSTKEANNAKSDGSKQPDTAAKDTAAKESAAKNTAPKKDERLLSKSPDSAKYHIVIDYTDAPELAGWVKDKLQPTCDAWYPKIVEALPSDGFKAPENVSIDITNKYHGVAATGGTHVVCDVEWFKDNTKGEAPGAVVHELVHVVQQYRGGRRRARNPGWLVEGLADYIRWFKYEPKPTGTRPRHPETASYTDSYRITAGFLNFVVDKHDKELIRKLNAAMRQGKYDPDLWKKYTDKSVDDLWKEYVESLK